MLPEVAGGCPGREAGGDRAVNTRRPPGAASIPTRSTPNSSKIPHAPDPHDTSAASQVLAKVDRLAAGRNHTEAFHGAKMPSASDAARCPIPFVRGAPDRIVPRSATLELPRPRAF